MGEHSLSIFSFKKVSLVLSRMRISFSQNLRCCRGRPSGCGLWSFLVLVRKMIYYGLWLWNDLVQNRFFNTGCAALWLECVLLSFQDVFNAGVWQQDRGMINSVRKSEADVVILGSSRAKHHYDPDILQDVLGTSVVNAGCDGQELSLLLWFFVRFFKKDCCWMRLFCCNLVCS